MTNRFLTNRFPAIFSAIFSALAALFLLCLPGRAIQQLIKSGQAEPIPLMVTDSSGNPVTGIASSSFTVTVRKPGAGAYVAGGGTVTRVVSTVSSASWLSFKA